MQSATKMTPGTPSLVSLSTIQDFEDNIPLITNKMMTDIKAGDYLNTDLASNVETKSNIQKAMDEIRAERHCVYCGASAKPIMDAPPELSHPILGFEPVDQNALKDALKAIQSQIAEKANDDKEDEDEDYDDDDFDDDDQDDDAIDLDESALQMIRDIEYQIRFLEGKLRGVIEYVSMNRPGHWVLSDNTLIKARD